MREREEKDRVRDVEEWRRWKGEEVSGWNEWTVGETADEKTERGREKVVEIEMAEELAQSFF